MTSQVPRRVTGWALLLLLAAAGVVQGGPGLRAQEEARGPSFERWVEAVTTVGRAGGVGGAAPPSMHWRAVARWLQGVRGSSGGQPAAARSGPFGPALVRLHAWAAAVRTQPRSDEVDERLAAVVQILAARGEAPGLLADLARDPGVAASVRVDALRGARLGRSDLRALVLDVDEPVELRLAAFRVLAPEVDPLAALAEDDWVGLARDAEHEEMQRMVLRALVHARTAVPEALALRLARGDETRRPWLQALFERPRPVGAAVGRAVLAASGVPLVDRLLAVACLPPDAQDRTHAATILDGLTADPAREGPSTRFVAHAVARRLTPERADRLVGALHARVVAAPDADAAADALKAMLPALGSTSPRGRRFLAGIARTLPGAARAVLVDWFVRNDDPAVEVLVDEMYEGTVGLEVALLQRTEVEGLDDGRRRILSSLLDPGTDTAMVEAAFRVLAQDPAVPAARLVEAAFADGRDSASFVETLIDLRGLPDEPQVLLRLHRAPDEVFERVLRRIVADRRIPQPLVEPLFAEAVGEPAAAATGLRRDRARRILLRFADDERARATWQAIAAPERARFADSIGLRADASARPWCRRALEAVEAPPDLRTRVELARLRVGDFAPLDAILADPIDWPAAWLRRLDRYVVEALRERPDRAQELLRHVQEQELDVARLVHCVRWLGLARVEAAVPALEAAAAWREALDPDEGLELTEEEELALLLGGGRQELRDEAFAALLRFETHRAEVRAFVLDVLRTRGMTPALETRALEVLGAEPLPLSPEAARLAIRILCAPPALAPGDGARFGPALPDLVSIGRLLREGCDPEAVAAMRDEWRRPGTRVMVRLHGNPRTFGALLTELLELHGRGVLAGPDLAADLAEDLLAIGAADRAYDALACHAILEAGGRGRSAVLAARMHSALVHEPPPPIDLRRVFGESLPGERRLPMVRAATAAVLAAVGVADAAGERERLLATASTVAFGDDVARRRLEEFRR